MHYICAHLIKEGTGDEREGRERDMGDDIERERERERERGRERWEMRERQCVTEALRKRGMSHGREKEVRAMKRVRGGNGRKRYQKRTVENTAN